MQEEWDWKSNDSVIFPTVQGIAVYMNEHGDAVIRQESLSEAEDDAYIVVPQDRLDAVIQALASQKLARGFP